MNATDYLMFNVVFIGNNLSFVSSRFNMCNKFISISFVINIELVPIFLFWPTVYLSLTPLVYKMAFILQRKWDDLFFPKTQNIVECSFFNVFFIMFKIWMLLEKSRPLPSSMVYPLVPQIVPFPKLKSRIRTLMCSWASSWIGKPRRNR